MVPWGTALTAADQTDDKTDVVRLRNGDRLTGEIKRLERGKLRFKTDDLDTVEIEWPEIVSLSSEERFEVELDDGGKYFGSIRSAPEAGSIEVEDATLQMATVVLITPIEGSFWARVDGSLNVGFSFAKANNVTQWTLGAEGSYRAENYLSRVTLSSVFTDQTGVPSTTRNSLGVQVHRSLGRRWFVGWLAQAQQNDELGLQLRGLLGSVVGRRIVQTNRNIVTVLAGAAFNQERFENASDLLRSAEAIGGARYEVFTFDDPEIDVTTNVTVAPSLSQQGRLRLEVDSRARIELISDLFWSIDFLESFDNDPPLSELPSNDFSVFTSLGWSF